MIDNPEKDAIKWRIDYDKVFASSVDECGWKTRGKNSRRLFQNGGKLNPLKPAEYLRFALTEKGGCTSLNLDKDGCNEPTT
jgi:hypothetical protein